MNTLPCRSQNKAVQEDGTYQCVQQINKSKQIRGVVNEMPMTALGVKRQEVRAERKKDTVNSLKISIPRQILFQ
jgi:hypothetical protein